MQNTKIQGQNNTAKEKFMSAPQVEMKELNNLFFELCYRACNLKCKHCYIEKNPYKQEKDFIPLDKIKNALLQLELYLAGIVCLLNSVKKYPQHIFMCCRVARAAMCPG